MGRPAIVSLEALRARIREIEGNHVQARRRQSGVSEVDQLLGGLPSPGLVEVSGAPGSGRTRFALAIAAQLTQRGRPVVWLDFDRDLYPPSVVDHGVDPAWLVIVQPSVDRGVWAAEQVLRSGCFPLVVLGGDLLTRWAGQRWAHAAEQGGSTGLLLRSKPSRIIPSTVRLAVSGGRATVVRDRSQAAGPLGRAGLLPAWPSRGNPWL
jgi:hypothetical protein